MEGSMSAPPPSPHPAGFIDREHLPPPPDVPPPPTAAAVSSPSATTRNELIRLKVEEVSEDGNLQTQGGVGGALQGRKKGASMTPDKLQNKKDQQKKPANALPRKRLRTLPIVRSPGVNHVLSQGSPRIVGLKRPAPTPSQLSGLPSRNKRRKLKSESAFSAGGRVLSDYRSHMLDETVEALICLQDWLRPAGITQVSTITSDVVYAKRSDIYGSSEDIFIIDCSIRLEACPSICFDYFSSRCFRDGSSSCPFVDSVV